MVRGYFCQNRIYAKDPLEQPVESILTRFLGNLADNSNAQLREDLARERQGSDSLARQVDELRAENTKTNELANDTYRVLHDCRKRVIKMEAGLEAIRECVTASDDLSGDEVVAIIDAAKETS